MPESGVELRFVAVGEEAYQAALRLRHRTFYEAHGIELGDVPDAVEANSLHLVAEAGGDVVGCGRLTISDGEACISQMVVAESRRRQGVGSALLSALSETAAVSVDRVYLSAHLDAVPFYRACGFVAVGDPRPSSRLHIPVQNMEMEIEGDV